MAWRVKTTKSTHVLLALCVKTTSSTCLVLSAIGVEGKEPPRLLLLAWKVKTTTSTRLVLSAFGVRGKDQAGNRTTRRPPNHCKETQTAVVWSCLPFIRSGQNHLARHSERGKKTRQTMEEVGRQHQGMDRLGVRQIPEGSGEQGIMEEIGCPTTLTVKG